MEKMSIDMEKELFKDMYYFELDRKEKLNAKVNLPITIIMLICGAIVYFTRSINMFGIDLISIFFWILYAGLLISTIITVYYICRSFYDYPYEYIPTASDFEKDINNLQEYYEDPYFDDIEKDKKGSITMCKEKEEPKNNPPPKPKPSPTRQLHEGVIGKVIPPKPVDTPIPVNTDSKKTE